MTVTAQLIGYPRIGPARELKWALERAWSGRLDRDAFDARVEELRAAHLAEQRELTGSAADDYFLYDAVLETAMMLGVATPWATEQLSRDPFAALSALARGTPEHEAWEMTKWFDTNYHYVVPEITAPVTAFRPLPWREPMSGEAATWVVIGPYTLARLSHLADGLDPVSVAGQVGDALWAWVAEQQRVNPAFRLQLDEPSLGMALSETDEAMRHAAYAGAPQFTQVPIVTVQFGEPSDETAAALARHGLAVQLPLARATSTAASTQPELVVSVMDGRSVWPDDFAAVRQALGDAGEDRTVRLVPSTSLMFLPITVEGEDLPAGFQFAREKARTLASWARCVGRRTGAAIRHGANGGLGAGRRAAAPRAATRTARGAVGHRPAGLPDHHHRLAAADRRRAPPARAAAQGRAGSAAPTRRPSGPSSPTPSAGRSGWAWTCWSTASSSGPTWSSTSPRRWTAT